MTSGNGHSSSPPKTADVVILGAGVMGTSIAFHLARRNAGKDRDHRQRSCWPRREWPLFSAGSNALQLSG